MHVIACYNIKGGVGKTASAVNLAYLSASEGRNTLVWDLDPQAAASFYFQMKAKIKKGGEGLLQGERELLDAIQATTYANLDLMPADFSLRNLDVLLEEFKKPQKRLGKLLKPVANNYDYVFLDCPPSISLVSESIFHIADTLLVPTIPTTLSLRTLDQIQSFYTKHKLDQNKIVPFFSIVDRRKSLHRTITQTPPKTLPRFMRSAIPYASEVEQMGIRQAALASYAATSRAAIAYAALWKELKRRIKPDF